ncbi:uncharacterized protein RJT21DRAFT_120400 [Scheffersomyces amazonensis]|uniref:uncharacterized protein n=1 Tax=Scheffersomyces amazonensis TaxID=1078765 RepID=UPI00315D5ED1
MSPVIADQVGQVDQVEGQSSEPSTPKSASALTPLRLSVPAFEQAPKRVGDEHGQEHEHVTVKVPRINTPPTNKNISTVPRRPKKDGFELDLSLIENENENESVKSSKEDPSEKEGSSKNQNHEEVKEQVNQQVRSSSSRPEKAQLKKVGELASLFQDTRKSLQQDCNVADTIKHKEVMDPTRDHKIHVSKISQARAEKVRSMIGVKYFQMQRLYELSLAQRDNNTHPGVEGVYNPLQIIRNRELRAKYHEYPKNLTMKSVPLACNVFSKYNRDPSHPYKMVWSIELKEVLGDVNFRANHWHELRNPKGQLWFPQSKSSSSSTVTSNEESKTSDLRQRIHDKLFNSEESIPWHKSKSRRTSSATAASGDSELLRISRTKSPASRRMKDRVKRHTRKLYNGVSSSSSDEDVESGTEYNNRGDALKQQIFNKVSVSPERVRGVEEDNKSNSNRSKSEVLLIAPSIKIDSADSNETTDINNVIFSPIDKKDSIKMEVQEVEKSEIEHAENPNGGESSQMSVSITPISSVPPLVDANQKEFQEMLDDFNYFEKFVSLKSNYLLKVYPNYTRALALKLSDILHNKLFNVFHATSIISDDYLPEYEDLYKGFSNEVKSVVHMINDDYSIKVDNLLSNSDRSISEINASLTLELRKVNERLDKLDNSLFGNSLTNRLKEGQLKIKDKDNYGVLYFCLENFIVILLRIIWVIVNLYKGLEMVLLFIWRIIKFIIY